MKPRLPGLPIAAILALLAACSEPAGETAPASDTAGAASEPAPSPSPAQAAGPQTLMLEGLGDLRIGEPVPEGSSFAERGASVPGSDCRMLSSPEYPGVYALAEGGAVKRITVGDGSDAALVEGIRAGSSEEEVRAQFPSFVETPHKYVAAPGKYLTQPGDDPRLRFEIDRQGKVSLIHVGVMPQLGYVENCA